MENEIMLKVSDVTKKYRLGQIGGGTLKGDLQSFMARVRHKEDPNLKIGENTGNKGDEFYALNGVSFEVKKGEAIGIIGHNGAGKSTLLKLISRVTAPTSGTIGMNGRIASMLEVGTGFHPELTGRENVYMNGAILGMTKAEIDAKMEEIIEFSEVRQFIDTPVKRYSSGMYVKLAFSVASHLDSEIMIMDEVLAVGDTKFQRKCIQRMREVANSGRTILYVSHNMSTIRQLCDRCIVLSHGKVIFEGDVEEAIAVYSGKEVKEFSLEYNFTANDAYMAKINGNASDMVKCAKFIRLKFLDVDSPRYAQEDKIKFEIEYESYLEESNVRIYIQIRQLDDACVASIFSEPFELKPGHYKRKFEMDVSSLTEGVYDFNLHFITNNEFGNQVLSDVSRARILFEKTGRRVADIDWQQKWWGNIIESDLKEL